MDVIGTEEQYLKLAILVETIRKRSYTVVELTVWQRVIALPGSFYDTVGFGRPLPARNHLHR